MGKLSKFRLDVAVFLLGRFARYGVAGEMFLPARDVAGKPVDILGRPIPDDTGMLEYYAGCHTVVRSVFGSKQEPTILAWRYRPNHDMRPQNWAARMIYAAFLAYAGKDHPQKDFDVPPKAPLSAEFKRNAAAALYDLPPEEAAKRKIEARAVIAELDAWREEQRIKDGKAA